MLKKILLLILLVLCTISPTLADNNKSIKQLHDKLATLLPGMKPDSIKPTPIAGMYEVIYGVQVFYLSKDGRYLLRGSLIDLDKREDVTEKTRGKARKVALNKVNEDEMIVYAPKDPEHTITIFTDVDCPYCQKLHAEIDEYRAAGIKVRYLMYPRTGKNSPSYNRAVSVWCADNPTKALTKAKQGKSVTEKSCDNPIGKQVQLGQEIGVTGTPAIILEDGALMPGYRPAKEIAFMLSHRNVESSQTKKK